MAAEWFYQETQGHESGPIAAADLRILARMEMISPDTLVKKGRDSKWIPAGQVKGLF